MAWGIKINGVFLDLAEGATISFQRNTELWTTGDPTIQEGSYSFPTTVPLTDLNNYHLRYPGRKDSLTPLLVGTATLYAGDGFSVGVPLFTGDLYVKNAGPAKASIFLIVSGLASKKELKIKEVDMGSGSKGSFTTLVDLMDDTTIHPLDHDYVFFPVWNGSMESSFDPSIYEQFPNNFYGARYQNHHRSGNFMIATPGLEQSGNALVTPFLRLKPVLAKIVENLGYTIDDRWLTEEELELICIYNNKSINSLDTIPSGWDPTWLYNQHLPGEMTLVDFLKKVCKWCFVGIFVDEYAKKIILLPYKMILAQAPRHNWTHAAQEDYDCIQDNNIPSSIGYGTDSSDQYFSNNYVSNNAILAGGATIVQYWKATGNPNSHSLTDGYYDVRRDNSVMKYDSALSSLAEQWTKFTHRFKRIAISGRGKEWNSEVIPLYSDSGNPTAGAYAYGWSVPRADISINGTFRINDEVIEMTSGLSNIRLCIYRGMRTAVGLTTFDYPYANATAYDPANEDDTFDYSLHYDGDRGIYQRFGKSWIHFMQNKKIVKQQLALSISDVLNHREYDIVRIDNINYFVKSMTMTFSSRGMELVDCELVSIPAIGVV